jgi:hypothetical protein
MPLLKNQKYHIEIESSIGRWDTFDTFLVVGFIFDKNHFKLFELQYFIVITVKSLCKSAEYLTYLEYRTFISN